MDTDLAGTWDIPSLRKCLRELAVVVPLKVGGYLLLA